MDDLITDKPDMIQQLLSEDADLDNSLVLLRDFIRDLFAPSDAMNPLLRKRPSKKPSRTRTNCWMHRNRGKHQVFC